MPRYWYPAPVLPVPVSGVPASAEPASAEPEPAGPGVTRLETALSAGPLRAEPGAQGALVPSDVDRERAVAVLQAVRRFRRSDTAMRSRTATVLSVNATDLAAMRRLVAAERLGESVSPTELAQYLEISSAATTKLLNRLAQLGHIRRQPHPTDRRAQLIVATDEAHTAIRQALGHSHDRMLEVVSALHADEQETVIRFLDALGAAVNEADAPTQAHPRI